LMQAVWPDAAVEEGNLAHNVTALRKALGDGGARKQHIETVPGRGYRFIADVTVVSKPEPKPEPAAGISPALSWEQRLDAARRALAAKSPAPARAAHPNSTLVGRTRELAELFAGWDNALGGAACVYCLTGEPGIGKTTLFEQFLADAGARIRSC